MLTFQTGNLHIGPVWLSIQGWPVHCSYSSLFKRCLDEATADFVVSCNSC